MDSGNRRMYRPPEQARAGDSKNAVHVSVGSKALLASARDGRRVPGILDCRDGGNVHCAYWRDKRRRVQQVRIVNCPGIESLPVMPDQRITTRKPLADCARSHLYCGHGDRHYERDDRVLLYRSMKTRSADSPQLQSRRVERSCCQT